MFGLDIGSLMMFFAFGLAALYGMWDFYETRQDAESSKVRIDRDR